MAKYNPYENMLNTLDEAAQKLGLTRNDYEVIRHPERELSVSIPVHNTVQLWGQLKGVFVSIPMQMKTKCVHWLLG